MALNGVGTFWGCGKKIEKVVKMGVVGLDGGRKCGFGLNLGMREEEVRWECCCHGVGVLGQRAITPVEDGKNQSHGLECKDDGGDGDGGGLVVEAKVFHRDLSLLPKPLSATDLNSTPHDGSKVRVAYQGVPGAYSEAAALKAYPRCETIPCDEFEAAFKALELWQVDKAVLPIDNSVGGSIHHNYDLLLRHRLHIVGEALAQCEMTLMELGVVRVSTDDIAGTAQVVASNSDRDTGAIASSRAAEIYGLDILAGKIQDDDDKITRFLILAREPIIPGNDRHPQGPGVLFKALAVFSLRDINLSKNESRPQSKRPLRVVDDSNKGSAKYFDYLFYIDFEVSMTEPRAQQAQTPAGIRRVPPNPRMLSYGCSVSRSMMLVIGITLRHLCIQVLLEKPGPVHNLNLSIHEDVQFPRES